MTRASGGSRAAGGGLGLWDAGAQAVGTGGAGPCSPCTGSLTMDRDLLRQSLSYHGPSLLSLLQSEQLDNPHFRSLLGSAAEPARGPPPQPPVQGR